MSTETCREKLGSEYYVGARATCGRPIKGTRHGRAMCGLHIQNEERKIQHDIKVEERARLREHKLKTNKIIGTMVWCQGCKTVVWAMDSDYGDLRGTLNMLKIPCRLCGEEGNYDGYTVPYSWLTHLPPEHRDGWAAMRKWARADWLKWNPSPDNTWRSDEAIREAHDRVMGE